MLAGPLPERRVRRAAAAHRLGPGHRHAHRPAAAPSGSPSPAAAPSPTAGCSACSSPAGEGARPPGRRARRGDGLRVAGRRRVHPRLVVVADRGHHPRPGAGHARRPDSPASCRSGTATRSAGRPSWAAPSARSSASSSALHARGGARARVRAAGLDEWAADNLLAYLAEQREATRPRARRPHDRRRAVPRRARRLAGRRALAVRRTGARAVGAVRRGPACASGSASTSRPCTATTASCFRLPDLEFDDGAAPAERSPSSSPLEPDDVSDLVTAARSAGRRCSRRGSGSARPGRCCCRDAAPTGASRSGSSGSARPSCSRWPASTPRFPIVLETVRECVQDVFDVPGLVELMRDIAVAARSRLVEVETADAVTVRAQPAASATSRSSSTRATRRWPSAGPPPSRSTRRCWPSCSAGARAPRCATCSTPRPLSPHRGRAAAAGARAAAAATPRTSPTCSACSGRCRTRRSWTGRRRGRRRHGGRADLAGRARERPPRHRGPDRGRGALGRGRGRRPAARRARHRPAGRGARGVPRAGRPTRSATWSPGTPAPTARSRPHDGRPPGSGSAPAVVTRRAAPAGRRRPGGRGRAAADRAGGGGTARDFCDAEVLRHAAAPLAGGAAAEVEPVPAVDLARFLPAWQGVGGAAARHRGRGARGRAARPAPSSRPAPSRRWCCPAGSRGYTPGPARRADRRPARCSGAGTARCPATTAGSSLHLADTRHADPARARRRARADRGCTRRCSTRSAAAGRSSSARSSDAVGSHRRPGRRSIADAVGPGLGRARSPTTRSAPLRARLGRRPHGAPATPVGAARHALRRPRPRRWARCPGGGPAPAGPRCPPAPGHRRRPAAGRCCPPRETDATVRAHATRARRCSTGYGVRDPRGGRGRGRRRRLRRRSTGCWRPSRTPGGCAAATSSRAWARRSSRPAGAVDRLRARAARCPGPATRTWTCRPRPDFRDGPAQRAPRTGPGPWCWPPPTRPTPTGRPCPGPSATGEAAGAPPGPQGGRAGRARRRGADALRRAWRPDAAVLDRRAGAAAVRGGRARTRGPRGRPRAASRWRRPTARSVLGSGHPLAAALAAAGFHATPRGLRLRR